MLSDECMYMYMYMTYLHVLIIAYYGNIDDEARGFSLKATLHNDAILDASI